MKTALVTGGSGYLGSHLCKYLKQSGWSVVAIDIVRPKHSYYDVFQYVDVRNHEIINYLFLKTKIDAVFHMAGRIEIGESVKNPTEFWEVNTGGTCTILNAMKKHGVKYFVYSSTAGVYKPDRINKMFDIPISEMENVTFDHNPYSASKLASENAIKQSGINYVIFRYFNLAGADEELDIGENHEPETHLIPKIFQNLNNFELYGDDYDTEDGSCVRDYVHVTDVAKAHITGVEYLMNGGKSALMNLGTGKGHSNLEIINLIKNKLNLPVKYTVVSRRQGDPDSLVADINSAQKVLNFNPRYDIMAILQTAYDWHLKNDK
jgi:UDP-glucose 4-epimerase